MSRSSLWQKALGYDSQELLREMQGTDTPEQLDVLAALGRAQIDGNGNFTIRREGDQLVFQGTVDFNLQDNYDFNKGSMVPLPVNGRIEPFFAHQLNILQESHGAKTFEVQSNWSQSVTGTLGVRRQKKPDGSYEYFLSVTQITWNDVNE